MSNIPSNLDNSSLKKSYFNFLLILYQEAFTNVQHFFKNEFDPPPLNNFKKLQYWLDMAFLMQNSVINSSFQPC